MQFTVSGVPGAHAAGLVAWLQIATVPKQATATPTSFAIGIHGVDRQPGTSLTYGAAQLDEGI